MTIPHSLRALTALTLFACAARHGGAQVADPAGIPAEQFFQRPAISGAAMSPNGRYIAVRKLSPHGRAMLAVVDAEARTSTAIANFSNADIASFYWLSDRRLAFTINNVYHGGNIGKPGLYAVDRDGRNRSGLTTTIEHPRSFAESDLGKHSYLAELTLSGFPLPSEDIFAIAKSAEESELVRLSTRNGITSPVRAPNGTFHWLIDADGTAQVFTARRQRRNVVFGLKENRWRELAAFDAAGPSAFAPRLYADGQLYVTATNGNDTSALYRYDLEKNAIVPTPLISADGFDADGYFLVGARKMTGYRFTTDAEVTVWFDETMKAAQQEIDQLMPATLNSISRGSRSETPYILVDSYSDLQNHSYSLYNRDTKERFLLVQPNAELDRQRMASTSLLRYKARDGLEIPAFVTLPNGGGKKKLPTVVLVGSLPWKRSAQWAWDPEVQFLASRGYVVLQPQARGAPGFGSKLVKAGERQWGLAMQDDLADAVKWAAAEGHTDPARVCIAGTVYGGYAAMMGLIKDPDLFKCGISWSGITDINAMFDHRWQYIADPGAEDMLERLVGDPNKDAAQFKQTSPLQQAARIKQPVLLAYGKEDQVVPFEHGRKFYEAVRAGNPNVEWLPYTSTVDDRKTQRNRIDLWQHIDAFLARNIGGK